MKHQMCQSIVANSTSNCKQNGRIQNNSMKAVDCGHRYQHRKKVRFGCVKVQEYGVTVGSYSTLKDLCPMQLTWEHSEEKIVRLNLLHNANNSSNLYRLKLSPQDRRKRIATVQGLSVEIVIMMEMEQLMMQIKSERTKLEYINDKWRQCYEINKYFEHEF